MSQIDSSSAPADSRGTPFSRFLTQPLWPDARLNRTTAGQFALVLCLMIAGIYFYSQGITYEGSLLIYMYPAIVLAQPYFLREYRVPVPFLVLLIQIPHLISAQVDGVQIGNWFYRQDAQYLFGRITELGEGPFQWTRLLYFGAEMPVMEYLYYPSQGYFQMTLFSFFLAALPQRWVTTEKRWLGQAFFVFFALFTAGFAWVYTLRVVDIMDNNWSIFIGPVVFVWAALAFSRSYRRLTRTPALWLWILCVGCLYMPLWEFFHSCINRDWTYVANNPMPPLYTYNGSPIPIVEPFGYVGVSVLFPALLSLLRDYLGKWMLRERT